MFQPLLWVVKNIIVAIGAFYINRIMELWLICFQDELKTYIGRVLEEAKEKWSKGEEPTREDGCFVSPVAYDIIQVQNQ